MQSRDQLKAKLEEFLGQKSLQLISLTINEQSAVCQIRLLIDKNNGVSMDDCANLNRALAGYIDEHNLFEGNYTIEVSSPGLDRVLKTELDFCNALGKQIRVVTRLPIVKQQVFCGRLKKASNRQIILEIKDDRDITLNIENIKKAKLEIRWK